MPDGKLEAVVDAARKVDRLAGFNVTVPYKIQIIPFLDELDARARRIQAVNTVVREPDGRLVGYNTDGQGFIDSIVRMPAADGRPLVPDLTGAQVLVLGAGGAARACAIPRRRGGTVGADRAGEPPRGRGAWAGR